jgi:hypothetical protein
MTLWCREDHFGSMSSPLCGALLAAGEYHGNNPEMTKLLHKAVRNGAQEAYQVYQAHVATRPANVRPHLQPHCGARPA